MSRVPKQALPTVQLLHELPDGSCHLDWLIAQDPRGRDPLVTFRVHRRVDELEPGERLDAERIVDHRPVYLHYEGPVSNDRGTVKRLASGDVTEIDCGGDSWSLEVCWEVPGGGRRRQRLGLRRTGETPAAWRIDVRAG